MGVIFVNITNDFLDGLSDGHVLAYTDDVKIFPIIDSVANATNLQINLDYLVAWSQENKLQHNIPKCNVVSYSCKRMYN